MKKFSFLLINEINCSTLYSYTNIVLWLSGRLQQHYTLYSHFLLHEIYHTWLPYTKSGCQSTQVTHIYYYMKLILFITLSLYNY